MRPYKIEEKLRKTLIKIRNKDKVLYSATLNKIEEIISCENIDNYKNLRAPMNNCKRVHLKKSFVLIFMIPNEEVIFLRLKHHDDIYK